MTQTAENIEESTATTFKSWGEMQAFFKENKLLSRACKETALEYDHIRQLLRGAASKLPMLQATVLTEWVALWRAAEIERQALSSVVKGIVEK